MEPPKATIFNQRREKEKKEDEVKESWAGLPRERGGKRKVFFLFTQHKDHLNKTILNSNKI